jgi:hypothetical protein
MRVRETLSKHLCDLGTIFNAWRNSNFCTTNESMPSGLPQDLEAAKYRSNTVDNVATAVS